MSVDSLGKPAIKLFPAETKLFPSLDDSPRTPDGPAPVEPAPAKPPENDAYANVVGAKSLANALNAVTPELALDRLQRGSAELAEALETVSQPGAVEDAEEIQSHLQEAASLVLGALGPVSQHPSVHPEFAARLRASAMAAATAAAPSSKRDLPADPAQLAELLANVDKAVSLLDGTHLGATCKAFVHSALTSVESVQLLLPKAHQTILHRKEAHQSAYDLALECSNAQARLELVAFDLEKLGSPADLVKGLSDAAAFLKNAAALAGLHRTKEIRTDGLESCKVVLSSLAEQLSGQPTGASVTWREPPKPDAPWSDKPKVNYPERLQLALQPDLTNHQRLDHLQAWAKEATEISYDEALAALKAMPHGESWGYKKKENFQFMQMMKARKLGSWTASGFTHMDMCTTPLILSKLKKVKPEQAELLQRLALDILKDSGELQNKKEEYVADCKTLVRVLIQEATK